MKLIRNTGDDRVIDEIRAALRPQSKLDIATATFSLFAFAETKELLKNVAMCRLVVPTDPDNEPQLFGSDADRPFRNRLNIRARARELAAWIDTKVDLRDAPTSLPQSFIAIGNAADQPARVLTGHCAFTTDGLGLTPGNQFSLIQCAETDAECAILASWFDSLWNSLPATPDAKNTFLRHLHELTVHKAPSLVYFLILFHLFKDLGDELDEERIVKSATGIRNTTVWKKLFKFQRDGVVGAIDKLERLGGCIIADSVGLGKTFEALAIIKYYELRNDRVLVLVPKAAARQLDALQVQRPPQHPRRRPLQLRRPQPHRPLPRRRRFRATSTSRTSTGATTTSSSSTNPTTSATRPPHKDRRNPLRPPDAARSSRQA